MRVRRFCLVVALGVLLAILLFACCLIAGSYLPGAT